MYLAGVAATPDLLSGHLGLLEVLSFCKMRKY
jgi:hypothetical protein